MIQDLAIYGAGGFGREMAVMVGQINADKKRWNLLGFFDDGKKGGETIDGIAVIGGMKEINQFKSSLSVMVALADPVVRKAIVSQVMNDRIEYPVFIHPRAISGASSNRIARGCIITAGCILTTGITLHDFVIVNLSATIGHDVSLGKFSSLMPGCNISGNVSVGENTLIGTGAQVLQNLSIGNNCKVGAGAVITKSFGDGLTLVGVPGKPVKRLNTGNR